MTGLTGPDAMTPNPLRPDLVVPDLSTMEGLAAARAVLDRVTEVTSNRAGHNVDQSWSKSEVIKAGHQLLLDCPWTSFLSSFGEWVRSTSSECSDPRRSSYLNRVKWPATEFDCSYFGPRVAEQLVPDPD
ncbi:unnamed protein product [Phytophthora fragariaefolia]|uniref:Unnamed protein product n=1 Tax=Phytophthora fragariaefolia TaxID=1490495 RepID=A0A9W7CYP1_9STRA|nr:unnamed protein product [Phytophthora fragariaefolia]